MTFKVTIGNDTLLWLDGDPKYLNYDRIAYVASERGHDAVLYDMDNEEVTLTIGKGNIFPEVGESHDRRNWI